MLSKMSLVGGVLAAAALLTPVAASASIAGPLTTATSTPASMVQSAQWWRWRRDDDDRDRYWRYRDWRYDGSWRRCRYQRHRCAERYDWGTWEYRRCVRWHGC
jgi:hypothetical protein